MSYPKPKYYRDKQTKRIWRHSHDDSITQGVPVWFVHASGFVEFPDDQLWVGSELTSHKDWIWQMMPPAYTYLESISETEAFLEVL